MSRMTRRICLYGYVGFLLLTHADAYAQIALPVVNADFEVGGQGSVPGGWTAVGNPMWIGSASIGGADPGSGYQSSQFVSASRQYPNLPSSALGGDAYSSTLYQTIDLTPYSAQVGSGDRYLGVSYAYFDIDGLDIGSVIYDFYDVSGDFLVTGYSATTEVGGGWIEIQGQSTIPVPPSAASLRITLGASPVTPSGFTGSARNVAFDSIGAALLDPPAPEGISDIVHGNLIQIDGDGNWTWYTDERAIVDPNTGRVLINSVGFSPSYITPSYTGIVDVVDFDPATGRRVRTQLSNLPGGINIQSDDHNVGALLVLPDGRYLAMYANHGNNGGLGDEFTRYRVSLSPGDSTAWTPEQQFNWYDAVPGANQTGNLDQGNVSYHNLFYLAAEDKVYDISRSYGRLSSNNAGQNMPNIVEFDPDTNSIEWKGQFLESQAQGYSAYPKYVSDGQSRIYFTTTESHPRNYNNGIYAGYIEGGQTFNMRGDLIDANLFDSNVTAGNGAVPDVTDFTVVEAPNALGEGYNRFWTADAALDSQGNLMALYTSRWNPDGATTSGTTTLPIDHRLHFARWNPLTQAWTNQEIARMGDRLFESEQDYTGVGALIPGDENTIYISTDYDPRDATWHTQTAQHEIYRGSFDGTQWQWRAITENSTVDNLRPIAPDTQGTGPQPVFWFRGNYFHAQNADTAIVGILDESVLNPPRLVTYVDADATNTTRIDGQSIGATMPTGAAGLVDGLWHERTGFGNAGSVLTSSESGFENAPTLHTSITGLADGVYDVYAYFWSDNDEDWRLLAGLEADNLTDFRRFGSQHAAAEQFATPISASANSNDLLLYRAYLGRARVQDGLEIDVFVDDWQSLAGSAIRTWYDGVGYALVASLLPGDYNQDGSVDTADYTVWRDQLGVTDLSPFTHADGDGDGQVTQLDYEVWQANFGQVLSPAGATGDRLQVVPEPCAWLILQLVLVLGYGQQFSPYRTN